MQKKSEAKMSKGKDKRQPVGRTSPNLAKEQIDHLHEIFPECVTEGKVDLMQIASP